jgi:hypothetical protein
LASSQLDAEIHGAVADSSSPTNTEYTPIKDMQRQGVVNLDVFATALAVGHFEVESTCLAMNPGVLFEEVSDLPAAHRFVAFAYEVPTLKQASFVRSGPRLQCYRSSSW